MITVVVVVPPRLVENVVGPAEFDVRATVTDVAGVTGLPTASWRSTVSGPRVALIEAAPFEMAAEVIANFAGAPALMVAACVPLANAPLTVMVGAPALVSP